MAQNIGNDGNQSAMADEERLNYPQDITNPPVRQSFSLPAMASNVPPPMPHLPYICILEEPTNTTIRFRYACEGRTAGSIPGMNSTSTNKTYPTIQIRNYNGPVVVVVTCVTADPPYYQHPHILICKEEGISCKDGVYSKNLGPNERFELQKAGIQCVKKKFVKESLEMRKLKNVDPFKAGFGHMEDPSKIDLYRLRLCYQAFIRVGNRNVALDPVVSSPINGKSTDLTIVRLCSCSSKMSGGDEIMMLCDKIVKNDISIRFFETNDNGDVIWEDYGIFGNQDVYKQMAITFKTPRYHKPETQHCVKVALQLVRKTDNATSEPREFEYYPNPGTVSQICRENAKIKIESVKRKLSHDLSQNNKQLKTITMDSLTVPQNQAPFMHTYQPSAPSPTDSRVPKFKSEHAMFQTYNYSSESSSPNYGNFPQSPNYGNLSLSPNCGNLPQSPNYGNLPHSSNYGNLPHSSNYGNLPHSSNYGNLPQSPNYGNLPQSPNYGNLPHSSNYGNLPQSPNYGNLPHSSNYGNLPHSSNYGNLPHSLNHGNLPPSPGSSCSGNGFGSESTFPDEQAERQQLEQQEQQQWQHQHPGSDFNIEQEMTDSLNNLSVTGTGKAPFEAKQIINFPQTNGGDCEETNLRMSIQKPLNNGDCEYYPQTNSQSSRTQNDTNAPAFIPYDHVDPPTEPLTTDEIIDMLNNSDIIAQIKNLKPE